MTKRPDEAKIEVRKLEPETLSVPSNVTTTTDRPVSEETRNTIGAALAKAIRDTRKRL